MARRLLCLSLLLAPAAAAANSELVLWHAYRAGEEQAINRAVDEFRAQHPEQPVRVLAVPYGAFAQKLKTAIPAGHGPDLFIAAHDQLGDMVRRELIDPLPIDPAVERFLPETLAPLGRPDFGLWGWPLAFKSLVLFYRTDLVRVPPATTDELVTFAKQLGGERRYGLAYPFAEFYFHAPWYFGFGAELVSKDGTADLVDSPAAAASGVFLRRLVIDEQILPTDANAALCTELFNRGRAAMVVNGPWFISEIADGVPWAVAPLPKVCEPGQPARPLSTVEALFIARGRTRPAVMALAAALTSDEAALWRAELGGQPVANSAVYGRQEVAGSPVLMTFRAQLADSVPMPTAPITAMVWEPLNEALRQIGRGALGPQAAFAEAHNRIEILTRPLPQARSPTLYVLALLLLVAAGLALAVYRRPPELLRKLVEGRLAFAFLLPTAVGMTLLIGIPFLMGIGLGFFAFGPGELRFVGFANFTKILAAADYGVTHPLSFYFTLAVTMLWTAANVALHVAFGFGLALLLQPTWVRGRGLFRVILILPWAIPNYITALVFKGLFNAQLGAVNALLGKLGVEPVGWFDSFWPAFTANLTTNVWLGFPFMMVTVLGALQAIPEDLYDAARVDGASSVQRFFKVTLPQVAPALLPAVILGTIWTFNMFNIVFLVSEGQPEGSTDILVTEAYRWAFMRNGQYGYAAAYSVVIFVILVLYTLFTRRLLAGRQGAKA